MLTIQPAHSGWIHGTSTTRAQKYIVSNRYETYTTLFLNVYSTLSWSWFCNADGISLRNPTLNLDFRFASAGPALSTFRQRDFEASKHAKFGKEKDIYVYQKIALSLVNTMSLQ